MVRELNVKISKLRIRISHLNTKIMLHVYEDIELFSE